jgi:hypothetical protein
MATTITEPRFLLTKEVAAALRCTPKRVWELAAAGVLEPVRLTPRGHMRFRTADVERLIAGEGGNPHE